MCDNLKRKLESLATVNQIQVVANDDQQIRLALHEGQTISEEDIQEAVRASGFEETFELKSVTLVEKDEG